MTEMVKCEFACKAMVPLESVIYSPGKGVIVCPNCQANLKAMFGIKEEMEEDEVPCLK